MSLVTATSMFTAYYVSCAGLDAWGYVREQKKKKKDKEPQPLELMF